MKRVSQRKKVWRKDYFRSAMVIVALAVLGVIIMVFSRNDHFGQCDDADPAAHFRPIESRHYGTPAGAPYSRVIGGRIASTYWNNDTTPVQVTDALCDPSLNFTDPSNPQPHRPIVTESAFWGQFITHSFALQKNDNTVPRVFTHFSRGFPGVAPSVFIVDEYGHQQINGIDPYLASSATYGHELEHSLTLRENDGTGKMKMSLSPYHDGHLIPLGDDGNFTSGDIRVRENYMLTAHHVLFCREHNYWAAKLAQEHPSWGEDQLYNTARHIVIGEIQAITYNEWLPTLLNTKDLFGHPACFHGKSRLSIRNEMATGALRMGHSLIPNELEARDPISGQILEELGTTFEEAFEQPLLNSSIYLHDIDPFFLGALYQRAENFDTIISGALVTNPIMGGIFNLGGFNIARGRDHGVPSYQEAYEDVTGRTFRSVGEDLTDNAALADAINQVYDDGDSPIDLWIGILAEKKVRDSLVGVVAQRIIAEQFSFMRDADPYYYEWDDVVVPWRNLIHTTTIADILRRNTNIHESLLQGRSFFH